MKSARVIGLLLLLVATATTTSAADAVDLASCVQVPDGVAAWAPTATITHLEVSANGFHIDFDQRDRWPDVTPPGWDGPIRWTVWLGARVQGRCHLAASLNVWNRDDSYGGPVDQPWHYPKDLWYLDAGLAAYTPQPGEAIYLMVSAGAERGLSAFKVAARSQVVAFPLGAGSWSFTKPLPPAPPVVTPPPVVPPVIAPPDPLPSRDLLLTVQAELDARLEALRAQLALVAVELTTLHTEVVSTWKKYGAPLMKYGAVILTTLLTKWGLSK
jgi:hypothetical protein